MQDVIDFVSQLGLPVALVIIVIVAIYKLARYIAPLGRKVVQEHVYEVTCKESSGEFHHEKFKHLISVLKKGFILTIIK